MHSSLFILMGQFQSKTVLDLSEICKAISCPQQTAYNSISKGEFPIPIRKQGKKWVGDIRDVADWLDRQRDLTAP